MKHTRAFTLVELSIVLVILGLLIGGVLTGQSLIRASELRSISSEFARFTAATHTFRDKYMGLPGDLPNAASYWGAADGAGNGNSAACYTTSSTDSKTCNGNGDGNVGGSSTSNEAPRFWQHLANAGLIEGSYPGVASPATAMTALNVPKGKINGSLWWAAWISTRRVADPAGLFDGVYGNSFEVGAQSANDPAQPLIRPEEAFNIDTKLDDGKPAAGKVLTRNYGGNCTDAAGVSTALNANYLLTNTAISCALIFRQAY